MWADVITMLALCLWAAYQRLPDRAISPTTRLPFGLFLVLALSIVWLARTPRP
jgi:prepilin signal peptidase PulO-like enzyme (type II secretory pathway)